MPNESDDAAGYSERHMAYPVEVWLWVMWSHWACSQGKKRLFLKEPSPHSLTAERSVLYYCQLQLFVPELVQTLNNTQNAAVCHR